MRHKHNTKPTGNLWYTASIQVSTRREEFGVEPEEGEESEEKPGPRERSLGRGQRRGRSLGTRLHTHLSV